MTDNSTEPSDVDVAAMQDYNRRADSDPLRNMPRRSILKDSSDNTVNTSSTSASSRSNCQVCFEAVQIRHYAMDLGDNPSCTIGAPVTLGWEFEQEDEQDIDVYEFERRTQPRRTLRQLLLNYYQRQAILKRVGYSDEELRQAERKVYRQQRQRKLSQWIRPLTVTGHVVKSALRGVRWN